MTKKKILALLSLGSLGGTLYFYDSYPPGALVCLLIFIYCFTDWRVR